MDYLHFQVFCFRLCIKRFVTYESAREYNIQQLWAANVELS